MDVTERKSLDKTQVLRQSQDRDMKNVSRDVSRQDTRLETPSLGGDRPPNVLQGPDKEFHMEPLMVQCLGNYMEPF